MWWKVHMTRKELRGREGARDNLPKGPISQRPLYLLTSFHTEDQVSHTWRLGGTHSVTSPQSEVPWHKIHSRLCYHLSEVQM